MYLDLTFYHFFFLCLLPFIFPHLSSSGSKCHFNSTIDFLFHIIPYSKPSEPVSTTMKFQVLIGCSHPVKPLLYAGGQGWFQLYIFFQGEDMNVSSTVYCSKSCLIFFQGFYFSLSLSTPQWSFCENKRFSLFINFI